MPPRVSVDVAPGLGRPPEIERVFVEGRELHAWLDDHVQAGGGVRAAHGTTGVAVVVDHVTTTAMPATLTTARLISHLNTQGRPLQGDHRAVENPKTISALTTRSSRDTSLPWSSPVSVDT